MPLINYLITSFAALLTLALFDSNPWWIVLIYAAIVALVNYWLLIKSTTINPYLKVLGQGGLGVVLAYLLGLTPFFRTTFGTLIGYGFLLSLATYLSNRFVASKF